MEPVTPQEYAEPIANELERLWPDNRTFTVVCHGHSVPSGYFLTPEVRTFDSYPHLLHLALNRRYPHAVVNVIVTAIGGENSISGAARFAVDVLPLKPDLVTIDYSLNDRPIGLEPARQAWQLMIDEAKGAGCRVLLLTPTWDLCVDPNNDRDPLMLQAQQVRELALANGIGLADSFSAFLAEARSGTDMETLMSQGNHPNRAGHELVVGELLPWFGADQT